MTDTMIVKEEHSLKSMITFSDRKDLDPADLLRLYRQAPWAENRDLKGARDVLAHTDLIVTAWDGTTMIAMGRVLTDYVYRASIWDVIVDQAYQGQDIGSELMQRILHHPALQRVELFWLCTRCPGFYEKLGFTTKEQVGMVWRRDTGTKAG